LYKLRDMGMRHGIFSEAITRLSKGQPALLTAPVSRQAIKLFGEITGAMPASHIIEEYPVRSDVTTLTIPITKINGILGTRFSIDDVVETLANVEFSVAVAGETVTVTPPYWRTDIHIDEDVVEEVGRLNGFDAIELRLPARDFTAIAAGADQQLRERIQSVLSAAGANQVLTYSFVHGDVLRKAGQSDDHAFALANALSPDLQYYRLSLTPSLLAQVNANQRQKFDEFALFELGSTHVKDVYDATDSDLPAESGRLGWIYAANDKRARDRGSAYYTAKTCVQRLMDSLHIDAITFRRLDSVEDTDPIAAPFEPKRSAAVYAGETYIGIVGEFKKSVASAFKSPAFCAGFELLTDVLQTLARPIGSYVALSRFPSSDADMTFKISSDTSYDQLIGAVRTALADEPLTVTVTPGDIYEPEPQTRHVTIRLGLVSYDRTLTRESVNDVVERVKQRVSVELGATIL
jgi:phenylalanyl-tRNA synthetase beta chain